MVQEAALVALELVVGVEEDCLVTTTALLWALCGLLSLEGLVFQGRYRAATTSHLEPIYYLASLLTLVVVYRFFHMPQEVLRLLLEVLVNTPIALLALVVVRRLGVMRSRVEGRRVLGRHQWMARTIYKFLENVITGKKGGEALGAVVRRLERREEGVVVFPKLLLLFPCWGDGRPWTHPPGSAGALYSRSRGPAAGGASGHRPVFAAAEQYGFVLTEGKRRTTRLELVALEHRVAGRRLVVLLAENRPLNTLYRQTALEDPRRRVGEEAFHDLLEVYGRQLEEMVEGDEAVREGLAIIHYTDHRDADLGHLIVEQLKRLPDYQKLLSKV